MAATSVAGRGTFIYPDLSDMRTDAPLRKAIEDAATLRQIGDYLHQQQAILASHGTTTRDKTAAGRQLYDHAHAHRDLLDRITQAVTSTRQR